MCTTIVRLVSSAGCFVKTKLSATKFAKHNGIIVKWLRWPDIRTPLGLQKKIGMGRKIKLEWKLQLWFKWVFLLCLIVSHNVFWHLSFDDILLFSSYCESTYVLSTIVKRKHFFFWWSKIDVFIYALNTLHTFRFHVDQKLLLAAFFFTR